MDVSNSISALEELFACVSSDGTYRRDSSMDALELDATQTGGFDSRYNNPAYDSFIAASPPLPSPFGAHSESASAGSGMFRKSTWFQ